MHQALEKIKSKAGTLLLHLGRRRATRGKLAGRGLEIGALHSPFKLPPTAHATYVDRLSTAELRHHYPELAHLPLVPVDIIDDAEALEGVGDSSQDFVIASHVLEHCEEPLGALSSWIRVLKPSGTLFLAVPDKRYTFDRHRPVTGLQHLIRDHNLGPAVSRLEHYREWAQLVEHSPEERIPDRASELLASRYSIHFHVWDFAAFRELLDHAVTDLGLAAKILDVRRNRSENLALLIKTAP